MASCTTTDTCWGRHSRGEAAIEVTFRADFEAQFDQAGLMLRAGPDTWLKTGVELSDGQLYASVVATAGMSDWSVSPLPVDASATPLTFRASRKGDAVTVRYRISDEPRWHLLRVAYFPPRSRSWRGPDVLLADARRAQRSLRARARGAAGRAAPRGLAGFLWLGLASALARGLAR